MARKTRLDDAKISTQLDALNEWKRKGDSIHRTYTFDGFTEAIAFINRIAPHAEELDHHPELFNVYDRVEITLTTHDANGLTDLDFQLARRIDSEIG